MTHVLRDLRHTDIIADYPALADQMKPFRVVEAAQPELAAARPAS